MIPMNEMYTGIMPPTGFMKHYYTLFAIIEGLEAKTTFEFGTGLSTQAICEALRRTGGRHTSCDIRDLKDTGLTEKVIKEHSDIWTFIQGDSRTIDMPVGPYDFVLHDGSHEGPIVLQDLKKIVKYMKQNSILLVHDTIDERYNPRLDLVVHKALTGINHELVTLPYGYGLTVVKILDNINNNGTVTPTWRK